MPVSTASISDPVWTRDSLQAVWERQRGRVDERIDSISRAIAALSEDRLEDELKLEAERAAHMLAGSVGMFGFLDASDAARSLESELAHPTPERVPALRALVLRVRNDVLGPVNFCAHDPVIGAS